MIRKLKKLIPKTRKNKIISLVLGILCVILLIVAVVTLVNRSQSTEHTDYAAKVNNTIITNEQLEESTQNKIVFFKANNQPADESVIRNDSLNNLINETLIEEYAGANNIAVTDEEMQEVLNARIEQFGNEAKLLSEVHRLYGLDLQNYRESIKKDLLREKVQASVDKPLNEWLEEKRDSSDIEWNI